MRLFVLLSIVLLTNSAFGFEFYRGTVDVEIQDSHDSYYKDAQVSYARDGDHFLFTVAVKNYFYFDLYGRVESNGDRVKFYHLPYGDWENDGGGDGKCLPHTTSRDDCFLWFDWNLGRNQAGGKLVTKFSDDALKITFGITGFWFPDGELKADFTSTLDRIKTLPAEHCKELPSPIDNPYDWTDQCVNAD